jgi:hypothetical protein
MKKDIQWLLLVIFISIIYAGSYINKSIEAEEQIKAIKIEYVLKYQYYCDSVTNFCTNEYDIVGRCTNKNKSIKPKKTQ